MKKIQIKNIYQIIAIIVFVVGLVFTYLIAELNDAPGFIFFGTAANIFCCSLLFGLGKLIDNAKNNNKILSDIYKEVKTKKR
jgi:uncharacterized membrane protein YoaK (UPF0700 family)